MEVQNGLANGLDSNGHDRVARESDLREMHHRLKNLMTVIQAISRQTMRKSSTITEFDAAFTSRLDAYGRTLDELVSRHWSGMEIHALARLQLGPFGIEDNRISVVGAPLVLRPEAAHALGLALHELATNAVKYGALSVPTGRCCFSWTVSHEPPGLLEFTWQEVGGPVVELPLRRGFGTEVTQKLTTMSLGGVATRDFQRDGVVWKLSCDTAAVSVQHASAQGR